MKKILFGIFAHPDDEAFGPSASLYQAAQDGVDVHLVLLTDGENGTNPDNVPNLGEIRLKEWEESGKLMGITSGLALHYPDGGLSNNLYHEIADKLLIHVKNTLKGYSEPLTVDFVTFEQNGITGHLDHVVTSFITTFIYLKLRKDPTASITVGKLKYYCLPHAMAKEVNIDWLYRACGKAGTNCDEVFDFADIADKKLEIMKAHYSQRGDMKANLELQEASQDPSCFKDHFCYYKD